MFNCLIPRIYSRPFTGGFAVPFMPSPVIQSFRGFGTPFVPMVSRMAAPISFAMPAFGCGNIFIQNMMQVAAKQMAIYRQQKAALAQMRSYTANSNYKFGTLTTRSNISNYRPLTSSTPYNSSSMGNLGSSFLKNIGYCASSGLRLAKTAMSRAVGFTGWCARYVKNAIASCGLGSYVRGDAHEMIRILRNNKKFKEIPAHGVNPKTLPPGCILVYGKGVSGYSSKYGHTEITTGDGRAVSDGITNNIRGNVTAIFVPVA